MVTGASTADLALILVDARKGVVEQSRRHSVIASLLSVRHLVLCVNKMDLVDYDQLVFDRISEEFREWAAQARHHRPHVHPDLGAARRQRHRSTRPNTPWYDGPTLLHHLEHLYIGSDRNLIDARLPVQWVDPADERQVARLPRLRGPGRGRHLPARRRGAWCCPSGLTTTIAGIDLYGEELDEAMPPMSVTIRLDDNLDVSRGDMICRPNNAPTRHPGDRRDDLLVQRAAAAGAAAST